MVNSFTAGTALRASDIGYITQAVGSVSSFTVTTSLADVTSASITLTTTRANTVVLVWAVFDVQSTGTTDEFTGGLAVDGVYQTCSAFWRATGEGSVAQNYAITLAATGSHTLKLQVFKVNNSNTVTCFGVNSTITIMANGGVS